MSGFSTSSQDSLTPDLIEKALIGVYAMDMRYVWTWEMTVEYGPNETIAFSLMFRPRIKQI